jgi:hypothetical protein
MDDPADLSHLADLVVPAPVPWWPPAPGWWILGAGCLAAVALGAAIAASRYRHNAYRRAALAELTAVGPGTPQAAAVISAVLKRAALVAYPRSDVASLTGTAWLAFLDRTGATTEFTAGPAASLISAAEGGAMGNRDAILAAVRRWVRRHRALA